jgi:hypothetical protein
MKNGMALCAAFARHATQPATWRFGLNAAMEGLPSPERGDAPWGLEFWPAGAELPPLGHDLEGGGAGFGEHPDDQEELHSAPMGLENPRTGHAHLVPGKHEDPVAGGPRSSTEAFQVRDPPQCWRLQPLVYAPRHRQRPTLAPLAAPIATPPPHPTVSQAPPQSYAALQQYPGHLIGRPQLLSTPAGGHSLDSSALTYPVPVGAPGGLAAAAAPGTAAAATTQLPVPYLATASYQPAPPRLPAPPSYARARPTAHLSSRPLP